MKKLIKTHGGLPPWKQANISMPAKAIRVLPSELRRIQNGMVNQKIGGVTVYG